MIKFTASGEGRIIVGLGLEPGNIERMKKGQPVIVRLADLGFTGPIGAVQIVIFTGASLEAMQKDVAQFIGPDTVVHKEPRRP